MEVFTNSEKLLVMIMGRSFRRNPYQIHIPNPQNKMARKKKEMSSAFLFWINLIICGSKDSAVNTPATIPTHSVN